MFTETFSTHPVLYSETKIRISAEYCIRYGKFFYLCIVNGNIYRTYK
ncbi:unknown [Bacteroides sp. CAG:714]|jgi:hypothetical protein|nr:unknown [Bacteroides sp. CAG:714]